MKRFRVKYKNPQGEWVDLLPGLTGDYDWAQKVTFSRWTRDGLPVGEMRIYENDRGNHAE